MRSEWGFILVLFHIGDSESEPIWYVICQNELVPLWTGFGFSAELFEMDFIIVLCARHFEIIWMFGSFSS